MRRLAVLFCLLPACGQPSQDKPPAGIVNAPSAEWSPSLVLATAPVPRDLPDAPLSLTASDGTALALRTLQARAVVEAPLSWTELTITFDNPENRVLEGRFQVELPPGADIARFAMKVRGQWMEGEVVERQRARQVYEDFLHRRADPALLEHETGNRFSARVFPIQPKGQVDLILSWSQADTDDSFRIPLRGLPELEEVDVSAALTRTSEGGLTRAETVQLHETDWAPDRDFELPLSTEPTAIRSGDFVVARVTPQLDSTHESIDSLVVLIDSSASRALHFDADVDRVHQLVAALSNGQGADTPVLVAAFDQGVTPIFEGAAGDFGAAQVKQLKDRMSLGATDVAGALQWLAAHASNSKVRYHRLLVVSDALSTAGDNEAADLKGELAALRGSELSRIDVLTSGGLRDEDTQHLLATAGLPRDGTVLSLSEGLGHVAERLELSTQSGLEVDVPGAAWVWPETLDGVQPGDSVLISAQLPEGEDLQLHIDGVPVHVDILDGTAPLVERASAAARIDRLVAQRDTLYADDPDMRRALADTATRISLEERVLSPWTALLVLETAWDYQRYGIGQHNLARVHTVGATGLRVVDRQDAHQRSILQELQARAAREQLEGLGYVDDLVLADSGDEAGADAGGFATLDSLAGGSTGAEDANAVDLGTRGSGFGGGGRAAGKGGLTRGPSLADGSRTKDAKRKRGRRGNRQAAADPAPPPPPTPSSSPAPVAQQKAPDEPVQADKPELPEAEPAAAQALAKNKPAEKPEADAPDAAAPAGRTSSGIVGHRVTKKKAAWSGRYAEVQALLAGARLDKALLVAQDWWADSPGDVLAAIALGEVFVAMGQPDQAERAWGSLIDLYPSRADLRRVAGNHLETLDSTTALALAIDTYTEARDQRPDHPTGHRMLAFALAKAGRPAEAFDVIVRGWSSPFRWQHEGGVRPVLREDVALLGAVLVHAEPARRAEVERTLAGLGLSLAEGPSTRFVLTWETDANDVDLHVRDGRGDESWFAKRALASGGALHRGVFDGYGPETFSLHREARGYPYRFEAHYYRRGPMGWGIGKLEIVQYDGEGGLATQHRPYVVMADDAWVDLGVLDAPLLADKAVAVVQ